MSHTVSILSGIVIAAASLAPSLLAEQWNKKTVITVNEAVQLPSCCTPDHVITLQPGVYVLVLVDSLSDRHIVRVMDQEEKTVILTTLAIPNYRLIPKGKTTFQYWETPVGQPKMMRAWFYPGDNFGQEFAYQKSKSIELAKVVLTPVPAIAAEITQEAELRTAALVVVDPAGTEMPVKIEAPVAVVASSEPASTPTESEPSVVQEPAAAVEEPAPAPMPATLPDSASSYPLVGLIGIGMILAYGVVTYFTRRKDKIAIDRMNRA